MAAVKGEPLNTWLVRHVDEGAELERRLAAQDEDDARLRARADAMVKALAEGTP